MAEFDSNAAVLIPRHHAVPGEDGFMHRVGANNDFFMSELDIHNFKVVDMIEMLAENRCSEKVSVDVTKNEDPGRATLDPLLDEGAERELVLGPLDADLKKVLD